jgi:hypothetical protein
VPPLDIGPGRLQLAEAADRRAELFEDLLLLGDQAVVDAARKWQESNRALQKSLDDPITSTEREFDDAFRGTGLARDSFFAAARKHLGVAGNLDVGTDWTWLGNVPQ